MKQKIPPVGPLWAATILTLMSMGVNTPAQTANSPAPGGSHGEVPVKQVVLFSSGVGYFQHDGVVQGDGQTELRFKTSQINDILKSLVLQDLDGGHVGTVTYPSQDPLEKTLGSFQGRHQRQSFPRRPARQAARCAHPAGLLRAERG